LDKLKLAVVDSIQNHKFDDETWYEHTGPRIAAVVAGVLFVTDVDAASLSQPPFALALVTTGLDRWLVPRFHSDAILAVCRSCEYLADISGGGHGALLAPRPPGMSRLTAALIGDSPESDRQVEVSRLNATITAFFIRTLAPAQNQAPAPR
jgi:hypothetical protein